MIFYITHEVLTRDIYRIEADSEKRAFEIALDRYNSAKELVRNSDVTTYRTSLPEEIFWSEAKEAGRE